MLIIFNSSKSLAKNNLINNFSVYNLYVPFLEANSDGWWKVDTLQQCGE